MSGSAPPIPVRRSTGSAHEFHHRPLVLDSPPLEVWIHTVERPAVVLGSSQPDDLIDRAAAGAAGWEVTTRRSGGGLVVVEPDESCWIDVVVTRDHPRWDDDVNRAFDWVGEWWRRALGSLGVTDLDVHRGAVERRDAGRAVCFAGLGPGEVVRREEPGPARKVVGLSQRRTRDVARFQGLYLRRWNPAPLRRWVVDRSVLDIAELDRVTAGLPDGPAPDRVARAFLAEAEPAGPSATR